MSEPEMAGLELPVLDRAPTVEEIGALLENATQRTSVKEMPPEELLMMEKFAETIGVDQRFHSLLMMQTLMLSTESGTPLVVKIAAMLEAAMVWGARLGVLMERRDREGEREREEVEEVLKRLERRDGE